MADNVTAPATGAVFATDDIGGVHWPFSRLAFGPDGTSTRVADADGARLPVLAYLASGGVVALDSATLSALESVSIGTALPAGANNIGIVDLSAATLAALESIQATVTGTVALDAPTLAALENTTVTVGAALPAGTNNIGDVDVLTVPQTATTTREYSTANALYLTVGASSAATALPTLGATREVYIHAIGARVFFRTGTDNTVTASVGAGNQVVAADEKFHFRIPAGHTHIAVIGSGGTGNAVLNAVA